MHRYFHPTIYIGPAEEIEFTWAQNLFAWSDSAGFKSSFTILIDGDAVGGKPETVMAAPSINTRKLGTLSCSMAVFAGLAMATVPNASAGESVVVTIDRAKVLRISRPADTIIIGNPSIADATIQDPQTLVLTGRSFGVTNIVILDADGEPIVDETIVVQGHETNTVRIYRRAVRETLACSPVCEPTLTIGDNSESFVAAANQIKERNALSDSVAAKR